MRYLLKSNDLKAKLVLAMKKPKKKYSSPEQKHHYWMAARHYAAWKRSGRDHEKQSAHVDAIKRHMKSGNFTEWHRDQVQHDSRYVKPMEHTNFVPYKKKKRKKMIMRSK